jgi:hypothetical protein
MNKTYYVITGHLALDGLKGEWYLSKRYPRRAKSGRCCSAATPQLRYARKFSSYAAAASVIEKFTLAIFDGKEKIIEIN